MVFVLAAAIVMAACIVAWAIFFVGRQIARVLWGLLVVAEKDDAQRDVYQRQRAKLFGDTTSASKGGRR